MHNTVRRFDRNKFDAAWIDREIVVKWRLVKVAMYGAKIREIRSTARQGKEPSPGKRFTRHATQRCHESNEDGDLGKIGHTPNPQG